eukprot:3188007-Rhodomonas_salina.7
MTTDGICGSGCAHACAHWRCRRFWTVNRTSSMGARVLLLLGVFFYTTHFTTSAKVRSWTTAAMTGLAPHGAKLVAEMGEKIYVVADSRYGIHVYMLMMRAGVCALSGNGVCS